MTELEWDGMGIAHTGIPWEWECQKIWNGMGGNGNWIDGNGREWECWKAFPHICSLKHSHSPYLHQDRPFNTHSSSLMWSETVGLKTRPVSDEKGGLSLSLGLAGLALCCETRPCYARHHNDLKGQNSFSSTIYSFFPSCALNITTVEINSGFHSYL